MGLLRPHDRLPRAPRSLNWEEGKKILCRALGRFLNRMQETVGTRIRLLFEQPIEWLHLTTTQKQTILRRLMEPGRVNICHINPMVFRDYCSMTVEQLRATEQTLRQELAALNAVPRKPDDGYEDVLRAVAGRLELIEAIWLIHSKKPINESANRR